jgi:hypothetical protein
MLAKFALAVRLVSGRAVGLADGAGLGVARARKRAVSKPGDESLRMFSWLVFQTSGAPVLFVL